jgi:hypothetical protein
MRPNGWREREQCAVHAAGGVQIGMERGSNQQHPDDGEHDPARHDAEVPETHRPSTLGRCHALEIEIFPEAAPPSSCDFGDAGARDPAHADDAEEPRTVWLCEQPRGRVVGLVDVRQRAHKERSVATRRLA